MILAWIARASRKVRGERCPYGCGAQAGFCRCGDGGRGDRKLTGRHRQTHSGHVVHGHQTGGRAARRR